MDNNNKKNRRMPQLLLFVLVAAMLLMLAVSANPDRQSQGNVAILLGDSGEPSEYDITIREEGSLQAGNLVLVLSVPDELYSIQMIAPAGTKTNRTLLQASPTLGESAILGKSSRAAALFTERQDTNNIALGASGHTTETKFSAPVAGEYQFLLFDADGVHVDTQVYAVPYAGALSVNFNDGKTFYTYHSTADLILDYSTNNLDREKVTLYLPPGYIFVSKPSSTTQYTVAELKNVPLPQEFYTDPNADILKAHVPATDTAVTALELTLHQGGTQSLSFTFSIAFEGGSTVAKNRLSSLMVAYGQAPDTIPMNLGVKATSLDGSTTHDMAMIEGLSDIVRGSNKPEAFLTFPHILSGYNPSLVLSRLEPYFWNGIVSRYTLTTPHYPVTNMKFYMPVPKGTTAPAGATVEVVDGTSYYTTTDFNNASLRHFSAGSNSDARNTSVTPRHEALLPGDVYEMEPGFITYTFKGEDHKSEFMPKTTVTVPGYLPNPPGRLSWASGTRIKQGDSLGYSFEYKNDHASLLSPVYEDVKFIVDVPYGVSIQTTSATLSTNNNKASIKHIEYYVDGDSVARFINITEGTQLTSFPLAAGERISKLIYHYDKWNAFSTYGFNLNALAMTHEPDGVTLLPEEYPVLLSARLETRDNVAIQMSATENPVEVVQTMPVLTKSNILYRVPVAPLEDGLRFGSRYNGASQNYTDREWTNYSNYTEESRMHFFLKTVTKGTKDYDNVQFTLKPKTPADGGMFSWMTALRTLHFGPLGLSEKRDVYYKTNTNDWRFAEETKPTSHDTWHLFALLEGEYVTEIKIDAGTVYGSKFVQSSISDNQNFSGEGHGAMSWDNSGMLFTPIMSHNYRNYFPGNTTHETKANTGDRHYMEVVVSTDSEAQHINPGAGASTAYNTNKARGSLTMNTNWNFGFERYSAATAGFNPANKIYYQGDTFTINYTNNASALGDEENLGREYNINLYVSVHKYFDILKLSRDYQFQSVTDIPGSDYRLYSYTGKTIPSNNQMNTLFTLYVRPDSIAPTTAVVPINNIGVSHDDFETRYIVPGYENLYPYAFVNFINQRAFPASWGITDKIQYLLPGSAAVKLEMQMMDTIELLASSGGGIVNDELTIYDNKKDSVAVHAFFGNLSDTVLAEYELELLLPRKARPTPSVDDISLPTPVPKANDIDFYLSGKISFPDAPVGTTYTYYDLQDTVVDMDTATPEQMQSVARILVHIKAFPPRTNLGVTIPLFTDYEKLGRDVDDLYSYIGANRRKKLLASSAWDTALYTKAFPLKLSSYPLTINIGLDNNEIGHLTTTLAGAIDTKVYFAGPSGAELLYQGDTALHSIKVNKDVSYITVTPQNPDHYMLTLPNNTTNTTKNSNFPRTGRLDINIADVLALTPNVHDAAFIIKPTLPIKDFTVANNLAVPRGATIPQLVDFRLATNNAHIPARGYYTQSIGNLLDPTLVDLTPNNSDKKLYALGKALGSTTFTYTLTNRLGDEFTVDNVTVNVVPNYVTKAVIRKSFASSHANLGADTFDFDLWNEGTATAPVNSILLSGANETTDTTIASYIERGRTHYIREIAKAGYKSDGYTGTIDGTAIDFTDEGNGVFSFQVPLTGNNVAINPHNKNASTDLTLRKEMDAPAIAHNPTQAFEIKVTEKGNGTPMVTASLKSGDTAPVPGLIFGRTYVVEETAVPDFALDKVAVEQAGAPAGTQPSATSDTVYEFTLGVDHAGSDIVVYNHLSVGKGIEVYKQVALDAALAREEYEFILTLPDGDTYYGLVPTTEMTFPAKVKWYKDSSSTTELDLSELKTGEYTLTEKPNINYALDEFTVTQGVISGSTSSVVTFEVTASSELLKLTARNRVKEAGQVIITKMVDPNFLEDTMGFTLTHTGTGRTFESVAKVTSNHFIFSAWRENGVPIADGGLPFGHYVLKETLEGTHYTLKGFHPAAGISVESGGGTATFTLESVFATANITAENKLTEKGSIRIVHVPNLDYGTVTVGSKRDVLKRTQAVYVEVENTLRLPTNWTLKASSDIQTALVGGSSTALPYQLLQYSSDGISYAPLSSQQVIMDQSEAKVGDLHRQDWAPSEETGIVAQTWFHPDVKASDYTSTVTWTLELAP